MFAKPGDWLTVEFPGDDAHVLTQHQLDERMANRAAAVLTRDAPQDLGSRGPTASGKSKVQARWHLPNGTTRTGLVEADNGLKAGAEVPVWLDRSGKPADPPLSTVDIVAAGVLVALFGWLAAVGALAGACACLHHVFDRHRYRAWETGWAQGEPGWHDHSR